MASPLSLLLLVLLVPLALAQCGARCRFRLCKADGFDTPRVPGARILIRAPDVSLSPFICLLDESHGQLGLIRATGEARVSASKRGPARKRISTFAPRGLAPPFAPNFFGTFEVPFLGGRKGIGRQPLRGNQFDYLEDLCVVLPITEYDLLGDDGFVRTTVKSTRKRSCVSFTTRNPQLLVELFWDSADDLDLSVIEPDGDILAKGNPNSEVGKLNNDNNVAGCVLLPAGKEAVLYRLGKELEKGKYTAVLTHFNNCRRGETNWNLRVSLFGNVILTRSGVSDLGNKATIASFTFTV